MKATLNRRPNSKSRFKGPRLSRYLKASAMAGAAAAPVSVLANFSGDYSVTPPSANLYLNSNAVGAFGNWTASSTGSTQSLDTTAAPNQISLDLSRDAHPGTSTYDFLVTAATTGLLSFNYAASTSFGFNGFAATLFVDQTTNASVPLLGSGPFSFLVNAGDVFGFELQAGYSSQAALTVSNFSAPEAVAAVPDAGSSLALLAFGFVGLLAFRANVQRAS
jgi:VPDSG-CTERM motif